MFNGDTNRDSCTVLGVTVVESRPEHPIVHLGWRIISRFCMVGRLKCDLASDLSFSVAIPRVYSRLCNRDIPAKSEYRARIAIRTSHCPFADNIAFAHGDAVKVCLRVRNLFFCRDTPSLFPLGQPRYPGIFYSRRIAARTEHCPFRVGG